VLLLLAFLISDNTVSQQLAEHQWMLNNTQALAALPAGHRVLTVQNCMV
jgi:hypothetical protein